MFKLGSTKWTHNLKRVKLSWGGMLLFPILLLSCSPRDKGRDKEPKPDSTEIAATRYDFYIENSGSMIGYFNGNSSSKTIITEYFNGIDGENNDVDTIALNYVNNQIIPISSTLKNELTSISSKCNATYTKIDEILKLVMTNYCSNKVAIVISDFCFTSDNGNFNTAQSYITNTFRKHINKYNEFSIIIRKYIVDFNGKYYPGGLRCNSNRPLYIWFMGRNTNLRKILNLNIKEECDQLALQSTSPVIPEIVKTKQLPARSIDKDNSIKVSEWKEERNEDCYKLHFQLDLSKIILSKAEILNRKNYSLTDSYILENIRYCDGKYEYTISTKKPAPGVIECSFQKNHPSWISSSNFVGQGIPSTKQTLGIQFLIDGVFDAYSNDNIFSTKILLK